MTPLELYVACEVLGQQRLPFPLAFGPAAETADEFQVWRRRAAADLRRRADEGLERALTSFGEPLVRVQAVGGVTPASGGEMASIRLCACVDGEAGVVAVQHPGPSFSLGGDIVLSLYPRMDIAQGVVAALPRCGPGREGELVLRDGAVDDEEEDYSRRSVLDDRPRRRSAQAVRALLERPASVYCEISAGPGTNSGPAAPEDGTLSAIADYPDDGRYLIERDAGVVATPAGPAELTAQINRQIAAVRQR